MNNNAHKIAFQDFLKSFSLLAWTLFLRNIHEEPEPTTSQPCLYRSRPPLWKVWFALLNEALQFARMYGRHEFQYESPEFEVLRCL